MFDATRFIDEEFGGAQMLQAELESEFTNSPDLAAIRKWRQRQSIPHDWFAACLYLLEKREGSPFSVKPYLVRGVGTWEHSQTKLEPTGAVPDIFA